MPSFQDILRSRQAIGFVGRERQLALFAENLRLPAEDPRRQFLFTVHGAAGIGKSFLVRQFRRIATDNGCATGQVDESAYDLPSALEALAAGLGPGKEFAKRLASYRQHRQDLDADPTAPEGLSSLLTRSTVRAGLAAAGEVPVVGAFTKAIDAKSAAEDVDKLRVFLSRKLRSRDDVELVLSPADVLTPALVNDITALRRPVALFFDTYERTSPFLDQWLRDLLSGKYGELPASVVFVVAGQRPLDLNLWADFLPVRTDLPLDVFTDEEARRFLSARGVTDAQIVDVVLALSGRLPVLVAMLAEANPTDVSEVGDPSGSAVERFLKWEPDPARRTAALHGALPRRFTSEEFSTAAGSAEHLTWLLQQPFVTEQADGFHYHDVVRSQMLRVLQRRSPGEWRIRHHALATHHRAQAGPDPRGNERWHAAALEESYHLLCAERAAVLPTVLWSLIMAFSLRRSSAAQWTRMIVQAGREADAPDVLRRGMELVAAADELTLLGLLVDDRSLPAGARALAHNNRGVLLRTARELDAALADFQAAVDLMPDNAGTIGERGETLRRMGRPAEAMPDLDRLVAAEPDNAWAYGCRGAALQALDRLEESLADLDRAIELRPGYVWALGSRAWTLYQLDRLPQALAAADQAIERSPDYAYGLLCRGAILVALGQRERAVADLERLVALGGHHSRVFQRLALTSGSPVVLEAALTEIREAGDRALCLWALGRHDEALAEVHAAVDEGAAPAYLVTEFQRLGQLAGLDVGPVLAVLA